MMKQKIQKNDVVVIFYFNDKEYDKAIKALKDTDKESLINRNVFLIDCRLKESASKPNAKPNNSI